jgi:hypothetical protein
MAKKANNKNVTDTNAEASSMTNSAKELVFAANTISSAMDKFGDIIKDYEKIKDDQKAENKKEQQRRKRSQSRNQSQQKKYKQGVDDIQDIFGKGGFKTIQKMFGKNKSEDFIKGFTGIKGKGKGAAGGVLGRAMSGSGAAGSIAKSISGVVKFGGQLMAGVQAVQAFAKALDSAAQTLYEYGTAANLVLSGGEAGTGTDSFKASRSMFEETEGYRKIIAEYNYVEPVKQQQAMQRDMLDLEKQGESDMLGYKQSLLKDELEYRNSLEQDAIQFAQNQAMQNLEAQQSRNKTLFLTGMGYMRKSIGVSERALQAIGSSTEAVLNSVKEFGITLGGTLASQIKMATAAAGISQNLGSSAEEVLQMATTFRLMNKSTEEIGMNLVAGITDFAKGNGVAASQIMKQMQDSSEEIFKYTNFTTQQFATQAVLLTKMNTSMSSMAKASDSMVLNYKDSIKAEMSLSAMLGKNVNLSEVRAKLMSGDMAGGASALKTALGGVDINSMNAFQKQALGQATGMDINELMNLTQSKGGGASGTIAEKNAMETGAAIANGALRQDVANEAAKMKLEQSFRAEMMKFEQEKRLDMLGVEQMQRLENLGLEAKFRMKSATLETEQQIDMAIAQGQAQAAASRVTNWFGDFANTMKPLEAAKMDPKQLEGATKIFGGMQTELTKLISSGYISGSDTRILDYKTKAGEAAKKGQTLSATDFFGGQKALSQKKVADLDAQIKKTEADLAKAKANENAGAGTWAQRNVPFYRMMDHGGSSWMDKDKNLEKNQANIKAQEQALKQLKEQQKVESGKIVDVSSKQLDTTTAGVTNDNTRGIIHLNEFKHGNNIQNELVAQQAMTNQLLQGLLQTTEAGKTISLDGITLNKTLLNKNLVSYGLNRQ